jgi:hypothetical protein
MDLSQLIWPVRKALLDRREVLQKELDQINMLLETAGIVSNGEIKTSKRIKHKISIVEAVLKYIKSNQGCSMSQIIEGIEKIRPGTPRGSVAPQVAKLKKDKLITSKGKIKNFKYFAK